MIPPPLPDLYVRTTQGGTGSRRISSLIYNHLGGSVVSRLTATGRRQRRPALRGREGDGSPHSQDHVHGGGSGHAGKCWNRRSPRGHYHEHRQHCRHGQHHDHRERVTVRGWRGRVGAALLSAGSVRCAARVRDRPGRSRGLYLDAYQQRAAVLRAVRVSGAGPAGPESPRGAIAHVLGWDLVRPGPRPSADRVVPGGDRQRERGLGQRRAARRRGVRRVPRGDSAERLRPPGDPLLHGPGDPDLPRRPVCHRDGAPHPAS